MSLGAEVIIEKTCFLPNKSGKEGHPVVLGEESISSFKNGLNNHVADTWPCNFVGDVESDLTVACRSNVRADAAECLASNVTFNAFW